MKIIFIEICDYKKLWWSERQLSGSEYWMFIQRTWIQFSGPHGGSKPCVSPVPRDLILSSGLYIHCKHIGYRHTGNTPTHIKDFLKRLRKKRKETTATSLRRGLSKWSTPGSASVLKNRSPVLGHLLEAPWEYHQHCWLWPLSL